MRPKIDMNKLKNLPTMEDMFKKEYCEPGTVRRDEFDAKSPCMVLCGGVEKRPESSGNYPTATCGENWQEA